MAEKKQRGPAPIIKLGPGRLAFMSVFEKRKNEDGAERYEATILLPPGFDTKPLLKALTAVALEEFGPEDDWPEKMRRPEDVVRTLKKPQLSGKSGLPLAGFDAGWTVVPAAAVKNQPEVVNAIREKVTDEKEVYGGRWGIIAVRPYAFRNKTRGVSLNLVAVQVTKHDKPFGGAPAAKDIFDDQVVDDDDVI